VKHLLPPLPYSLSSLEPHIAAHSLAVHHGQHHAVYFNAFNLALETAPDPGATGVLAAPESQAVTRGHP
jgi:Fe-Mn family superoxide dismutase